MNGYKPITREVKPRFKVGDEVILTNDFGSEKMAKVTNVEKYTERSYMYWIGETWFGDGQNARLVLTEDERIKNKLIKLIKMSSEVGGFALHKWEADEMLAWLEKQGKKEQDARYKNLEELLAADDIYQMAMNDAMVNEANEKAAKALSELSIGKLLGFEKQNEQKSKWSEEDRNSINKLICFLSSYNTQALMTKEDFQEFMDWLKSLKQRMGE